MGQWRCLVCLHDGEKYFDFAQATLMALEQLEAVACWHFDWAFRIMQTLRFVDVAGGGVPLIPHELSSCLSLVSDFSA